MGLVVVATGCRDDMAEKLKMALSSSVDSVTIDDTNIESLCKGSGEKVTTPTSDLELNALGLADIEKLTAVAQKIKNGCEGAVRTKRDSETQRKNLEAKAKDLKLTVDGKSDDEIQTSICASVRAKLPLRGEKRARMIQEHVNAYGCTDPGTPDLPAWGFWEIDKEGSGKNAKVSLKLDSDDDGGGVVDRIAIRCTGKKLDAYIASTEKLGSAPLVVVVDGKSEKWKTKLSSDKKAAFLPDIKKSGKSLSRADSVEVTLTTAAKKKIKRVFSTKGFAAAQAKLPKACRL